MKKIIWVLGAAIFAVLFGFFIGKIILKTESNDEIIVAKNSINEIEKNNINTINAETIETNVQEEKISLNTVIKQIIYYNNCNHQVENKISNIEKYVNMNRERFQKEFPGWEIKEFNKNNVILYKEEEDFCNEHFLVKDEDGYITIYTINNEEQILEILDKTDIATKYLARCGSKQFKKGNDYLY